MRGYVLSRYKGVYGDKLTECGSEWVSVISAVLEEVCCRDAAAAAAAASAVTSGN